MTNCNKGPGCVITGQGECLYQLVQIPEAVAPDGSGKTGAMIILHAQPDQQVSALPPDMARGGDLIVLAGAVTAFDGLDLPHPAGAVGGDVLRLTLLQPQPSAHALLAECAALFAAVLARHSGPLSYRRAGQAPLASASLPSASVSPASIRSGPPVCWRSDASGAVTAFRLAPAVAASPLLAAVTRDLCRADLTDDRRFAFLAAAFAGA